MSGVTEEKLLAGPILAGVGGLVIFLYGAYETSLGTLSGFAGLPSLAHAQVVEAGAAGVGLGMLIVALAFVENAFPKYHRGFGGLLIFLAICSLVSIGGGNGVGFLLVVLGGTCCIVYGPAPLRFADAPS